MKLLTRLARALDFGCDHCDVAGEEIADALTRFELNRDGDAWEWILVSANGSAIARSAQVYATKTLAKRAAKRVPRIAAVAVLVETEVGHAA